MRDRMEFVVAGLLTALAVSLHVVFFLSAGPLWRDEVGALHTATFPASLLWQRLNLESFPLLWVGLLRFWTIVFGPGVIALRLFGLLTGIGIVAGLWIAARAMNVRAPLFSLAAVALSGSVVRFGDGVRAYGWSAITSLLVLGTTAIAARSNQRRDWVIAAVAAVIAVQTAFLNAVIVLAICVAAMVASRRIVPPLIVGGVAAASLLLYVGTFRARASWAAIDSVNVDLRSIAKGAFAMLAKNGVASAWAVSGVILFAIVIRLRDSNARFALTALLVLLAAQAAALAILRRPTVPWYYLAAVVVAGPCVDALIESPIIAVAIAAIGILPAIGYVSLRSTNADTVATAIRTLSRPGDFVVVYPWYCGVTLAPELNQNWMTLPPIADLSVHRFDLLKRDMQRPDAVQPVIDATRAALTSGHRVWLAGFPLGSEGGDADRRWSGALGEVLRTNARRAKLVIPDDDPRVIANERMQLVGFQR